MRKIITLITLMCLALFSCAQEEIENERPVKVKEMPTTQQVNDSISKEWNIPVNQVELVNKLLNWALQVDIIYIDLLLTNENLADRIEDSQHQWCLECKMKALKFCYEHAMWGDTVGEMSDADELEELIDSDTDFANWWKTLDYTL